MTGSSDNGHANLFEVIVESATDFAIFTTDVNGDVTSWNIGATRLLGYAEPDILGHSADIIFTPEDRAADVPADERMRARRDGRAADDRWHQRQDGSQFWASGLLMPLANAADGFVKIARDRTENFEAVERLRENEERFRLLATSIPQLVFRTRPDGDRTWGSPQWVDFTGLDLEHSLGSGWMDAVHPEDRQMTRTGWEAARASGEYHVEHRIRRATDGAYRWHQTRARPVDPTKPETFDWVGTMTDIDNLRSLKDRQQVMMAELQHRTRNLLAVVQSIATQTIRTSPSVEDFGREFSGRLRSLSRVQSVLVSADHGDIDLRALVTAEIEAHAEHGVGAGKISIDGPAVALPAISAQAFGLALHELATNAVKYGAIAQPAGRLAVTWQVETADPPRVVLHWHESGVEMPPADAATRRGYGTELIERALPYQLRAETRLEFRPDGVFCAIAVPLATAEGERSDD
ncbi:MAG: histidine kinase [Alphaproteobacteria bacterium]|nr:MAG: histidine kinase [Alphaproteobacteria bacterium]